VARSRKRGLHVVQLFGPDYRFYLVHITPYLARVVA
jgi:hypothetical protein